jgi:hypothetical protein
MMTKPFKLIRSSKKPIEQQRMRSRSILETLLLTLMVFSTLSSKAQRAPVAFETTEHRIALLELFSSEGCSSCPPAETWLSGLTRSPRLWRDFVPLSFHVDYWDYLGWRDPWATKEFSDRQRNYAEAWRRDSVYTPGFVLNGREWREWWRPTDGPRSEGAKVGILKISSKDQEHWQVRFEPGSGSKGEYAIHAALLESGLVSEVKAGENRGRRLTHDFVVAALTEGSMKVDENGLQGELLLRENRKTKPQRLAIAVWVTCAGRLEPVQAVGGWLPN